MSDEDSPIGIPLAEARRRLEGFSTKRLQIINAIRELNVDPLGDNIPTEYLRLKGQLAANDKNIEETREWYLVREMESLDESSQRLKESAEKQLAATSDLRHSSRTLEALTSALFVLTAILAVVGSGSYFLQAEKEAGVNGLAALGWASIGTFIVVLLVFGSLLLIRRRYPELRPSK